MLRAGSLLRILHLMKLRSVQESKPRWRWSRVDDVGEARTRTPVDVERASELVHPEPEQVCGQGPQGELGWRWALTGPSMDHRSTAQPGMWLLTRLVSNTCSG